MRVRVEGGTRDQQFILTLSICGCFISSELGAVVSEDERPGSTIDVARKTGEAAALDLSSALIVQLGLALV